RGRQLPAGANRHRRRSAGGTGVAADVDAARADVAIASIAGEGQMTEGARPDTDIERAGDRDRLAGGVDQQRSIAAVAEVQVSTHGERAASKRASGKVVD